VAGFEVSGDAGLYIFSELVGVVPREGDGANRDALPPGV
jgi:hypothetical protein